MKKLCLLLTPLLGWMCISCASHSEKEISIFAASSLIEVLPALLETYETKTDIDINVVYGGSNHLAAQINDGAPIDLFLTADVEALSPDIAEASDSVLASNYVVLATPIGSEKNISGVMDLSRTDLSIAVCAQEVPCGKAAESLGVSIAADTYEPSVRAVISRLTLGEVDLGVVYATDVISEPQIISIWPDSPQCPCVDYHGIAFTPEGEDISQHLSEGTAQAVFTEYGFLTP